MKASHEVPVPTVINCRKAELARRGYNDLLAWKSASPTHVYIGRDMTRYVPGSEHSKWHNPFKERDGTLEERLAKFEHHIRSNKELWEALPELAGATEIGCWCAPAPCHGQVLVRLLQERLAELDGGAAAAAGASKVSSSAAPAPAVVAKPAPDVPASADFPSLEELPKKVPKKKNRLQ